MGSGSGKVRRARATSVGNGTAVLCDKQKWEEFVSSQGLEQLTLQEYYLGDSGLSGKSQHTTERYKKIHIELFKDAVTVGAINIPNPYTVDDFKFKVKQSPDGMMTVWLMLKRKTDANGLVRKLDLYTYDLEYGMFLGDADITGALGSLCEEIRILVA